MIDVLTCQSAASAAELGVVSVAAVSGLHDQLAVGEVRVVGAGLINLQDTMVGVHTKVARQNEKTAPPSMKFLSRRF